MKMDKFVIIFVSILKIVDISFSNELKFIKDNSYDWDKVYLTPSWTIHAGKGDENLHFPQNLSPKFYF